MSCIRFRRFWLPVVGACVAVAALARTLRAQSEAQRVQQQLEHVREGMHGPFAADWNSLGAYRVPEWFRDAKFGIFIHWGV